MNLFVSNISPETTESDLQTLFSEFGEVVSTKVIKDPTTGQPRGFGFVEILDKYDAILAIDNLDCTYLKGQIINVKEAKPKTSDRGDRGSSDRGNSDFSQRKRFTKRPDRGFNRQ